jgi:hypothetical protein
MLPTITDADQGDTPRILDVKNSTGGAIDFITFTTNSIKINPTLIT